MQQGHLRVAFVRLQAGLVAGAALDDQWQA